MWRLQWLAFVVALGTGSVAMSAELPNLVIIFADDLGYGDLGCYGHPTIRTPHLDRMAAEGMRMTQFYSAAEVCTPSRAALLTGRLPVRSGMASTKRRVLFPESKGGLPQGEITIAEALHSAGYATACVGKWHLGHLPEYLPTRHGFDEYFGIPYSNDMRPRPNRQDIPPLPLMRNEETIETEPDQGLLTERYTEEAIRFVKQCTSGDARKPFFLYLPHTMPHVPLYASQRFAGTSRRGLYGDVVETIDWSTGQILQTLRQQGVAENTLVVFTSDNGPWLTKGLEGGTAGLLRDGKGSTWEGGMREPGILWWPGTIKPGQVSQAMSSTLDLFPTACALAGVATVQDRVWDGVNLLPLLKGETESVRDVMYYYRGEQLFAVRQGPFKAHFKTQGAYGDPKVALHDPPLLYNLDEDPGEQFDVAKTHADVVARLSRLAEQHLATVEPVENQLER